MPRQTIYITSAADLSVKNSQLQITLPDRGTSYLRSIEDLGTLIIDHHSAHLTVPCSTVWQSKLLRWYSATNSTHQPLC